VVECWLPKVQVTYVTSKSAWWSRRKTICLLHLQAVPAEKLLVYEVSQGWAPLCKFLGKPIPAQPFPRTNDTAEWQKRLQAVRRLDAALTYGVPAAAVAVLAAAVAIGRVWLQRSQRS
jgi:hypothetical protein